MKKLTLFAASFVLLCMLASAATRSKKNEISRNLDIFNALYKELQTFYVDSIDAEKSINTAIAAMLDDIDPYTEYSSAKDQDAFRTMTTGEYGGIGSVIQQSDEGVIIAEPYEGSPAQKAGLRPGDLFVTIDGDTVLGWTSDRVSNKLKGQSGSTLRLVMKRPWTSDSIKTFEFKRAKIQIPPVPYVGMVRPGIGYIGLNTFSEKSYPEVRAGVERLIKEGAKGLILDLRGNGGGLLESAVDIVGNFVPKGTEVLRTRGRDKASEKIYKTTSTPIFPDIPLAVLIDGASASASEITAGALQDLDRAVLVGSRSYGKGLVQSTRPLPYDGLLKVTIAKYYIPSGRLIQALDYSHRNPDGSVARTPDSLTNVYKTLHGREVRDGGGLKPDVEVDWGTMNRMLYNIVRDFHAFDFATKYVAEHPTIPAPEDFEITDEIYADFKASIDPEKFQYDKVCEEMVKQLRETAEAEGYMNDATKAQIDTLAKLLTHDLQHDLDTKRPEISEYLAGEIVGRYYYDRGRIIQDLKTDNGIRKAREVLNDPAEYRRMLSAPKKEE